MKVPNFVELEFGEPWKLKDASRGVAIPVLIKETVDRKYKLFSEANCVTIKDGGPISPIPISNDDPQHVFFRKGTIIKGNTQTRAVIYSVLVGAGTKANVEVRCIYASKGIQTGAIFMTVNDAFTPREVTENLAKGQSETWGSVEAYTSGGKPRMTSRAGGSSIRRYAFAPQAYSLTSSYIASNHIESGLISASVGSLGDEPTVAYDNLEAHIAQEGSVLEEAMRNVPVNHERQIGIVVVDANGVAGFEVFDNPASWSALSKGVIKNYSDILTQNAPNLMEVNKEKAVEEVLKFICEIVGMDAKVVWKQAAFETYNFGGGKYDGEFTSINGDVIHLMVTRNSRWVSPPKIETTQSPVPYPTWRRPQDTIGLVVPQPHKPSPSIHTMTSEIDRQSNAALIVNFLTKKRGYETLISLRSGPKSFGELVRATKMSTETVTKGINEAISLGLVRRTYRVSDSTSVYELTEYGKATNPERFKASLES